MPQTANLSGAARRMMEEGASRSTGGRILAPLVPLVVVIYMFLLFPVETHPRVLGVSLPIFRVGILMFLPFLLARFLDGRTRPILADWLIILASGWILISFGLIYGLGEGLVRGFGVVVDMAGSYALARLAINTPADLRRFLVMISPGLFYAGAIMMVESVSHQIFYRPFFANLAGGATLYQGGEAVGVLQYDPTLRGGLLRAYGPFSHPILGGILLASLLPLWVMGGLRSWPKWLGVASALMGFFALSSAAILGLILAFALITFDRWKKYLKGIGWPLIAAAGFAVFLTLEVVSNRPLGAIFAQFTLAPETAYYRLLIWDYGSKVVADNPWIGIGYKEWQRADWMSLSVDNHFLALAMRNGLPSVVLLLVTILFGMVGCGARASQRAGLDRDLMVALNFTITVLLLCATTVMYFGEANVFFMIIIGIACSFTAGVRLDRTGSIVLDERVARQAAA